MVTFESASGVAEESHRLGAVGVGHAREGLETVQSDDDEQSLDDETERIDETGGMEGGPDGLFALHDEALDLVGHRGVGVSNDETSDVNEGDEVGHHVFADEKTHGGGVDDAIDTPEILVEADERGDLHHGCQRFLVESEDLVHDSKGLSGDDNHTEGNASEKKRTGLGAVRIVAEHVSRAEEEDTNEDQDGRECGVSAVALSADAIVVPVVVVALSAGLNGRVEIGGAGFWESTGTTILGSACVDALGLGLGSPVTFHDAELVLINAA